MMEAAYLLGGYVDWIFSATQMICICTIILMTLCTISHINFKWNLKKTGVETGKENYFYITQYINAINVRDHRSCMVAEFSPAVV